MNTNALKRFAQQTRTLLLEQVATRLHLVLKTDSVELRERAEQVAALRTALQTTTAAELVDKVAYTWFNRLVALRYLDVNGYQPLGVRIVSPAETDESHPLPEVLQLAQQGMIDSELLPDQARVMGLLRGTIPSQNVDNEVYRELLVGACNSLHTLFPFLFEPLQDHTELLLPADLTTMYSVVYKVRNELLVEDCQHVEVLGWLYQFYIAERKDAVFAAKTKVKKEDIPAATQLFTPRWIVEYMVQNTLGKLWLQHHPDSGLRQHMPYFIESPSLQATEKLPLSGPEELTVLDPACGSGHLLIYAFELLAHIYEEEAYSKADIPGLILTNNLRGLEIDERAAQLAGFALMMKARSYHNRAFRKELTPHITHLKPLVLRKEQAQAVLAQVGLQGSLELWHDLDALRQVDNIGSLLVPRSPSKELSSFKEVLVSQGATADMFQRNEKEALIKGLTTLIELSKKSACVAANPPYMGNGNMNAALSAFVKKNYPDSKTDLMACFMESSLAMLKPCGYLGMINQQSWMFAPSYDGLRIKLIDNLLFDTLLHLGPRTFPEIDGEKVQNAAFVLYNKKPIDELGIYIKLTNLKDSNLKKEAVIKSASGVSTENIYQKSQKAFSQIPGNVINYWFDNDSLEAFSQNENLNQFAEKRLGLCTGDNEYFLRLWHEVSFDKIGFNHKSIGEFRQSGKKYAPHNKGGEFKKWFGNNDYLIKFDDSNYNKLSNMCNKLASKSHYFRPCITWSELSSAEFAVRFQPQGTVFNIKGPSLFPRDNNNFDYILGLANSSAFNQLLKGVSNGLSINGGDVENIPFAVDKHHFDALTDLSKQQQNIAKYDWDKHESSWDFKGHPLMDFNRSESMMQYLLSDFAMHLASLYKQMVFNQLEINKIANSIYKTSTGIKLSSAISSATVLSEELSSSGNNVFDLPGYNLDDFDRDIEKNISKRALVIQLISYAVGCMFGRYSLDKQGLILVNQGEDFADYLKKTGVNEAQMSFVADKDNIIPVLDDEWFEDDIVAGFTSFLKAAFGEKNTSQNLNYVEECLGKTLRQYFSKDFFADHARRYSKRPIYWCFSSPTGAFSVLVYLHRYNADTLNLVLNRYLRPLLAKFHERIERLKYLQISSDSSSAERNRALKEQDRLERQLREIQDYERDTLLPLANARISINLDEGVLVNYNKFGKAVREVAGLNDIKAKAKVRAFDWIDATQIR
ncbi:BREX-1 system adenine-specific DNA-methyltransferase PglX [Hymenobacter artigasi]|uniref:site-specific DNA-methyltransferase (adenine-specific) n=1 Tax=Hymenobacter artigasi TaxID=2719616 RepID=A0ABX1HQM0_9BACT|nr:BREX-1 system adenine-specific DNA-methyltransferase PglX [Hymenobacter artigasi]NKI91607.1 hypothetical protein [Hymenobacter artigasi]